MSAEYQDVNKKFTLGDHITDEQKKFYEIFGFVHFKKVFDEATIMRIREEIAAAADRLVQGQVETIKGVPIKYGYNSQNKIVPQRTPFMNFLSPFVNDIVTSDRLKVLLDFIPNSRFAFEERDGVVINHYVNAKKSKFKRLGWHNDSLRDLFYFEKVRPMLNVGIGLFPSSKTLGGLRLIPGTHKQSVFKMMFGKLHILDGRPDPREIPVEVEIGDLTLHDGRIWHRAQAPTQKLSYERKSFYFPIICGPHRPKDENSAPPFYLRFFGGIDIKKATKEANEQSKT
ncbi:MAG: phytanoyl-CoA dioxygenase family protein [Bdellovibrionales bacterium]|nr:phytanoyl-CoA dioxygenase family protein [Bdellovibrionales bacterium]